MNEISHSGKSGEGSLIAVVGCDGSGKSTLTEELFEMLKPSMKVYRGYLGLGSGNIRLLILRIPLIGNVLERFVTKRADQSKDPEDKIPGLPTALALYLFTLLRRRRFSRAMRRRAEGFVVLTDRYPQIEVPGIYDGPLLQSARAEGRLINWLADRERQQFEAMVAVLPDLVIKLHVNLETALARKPDHIAASLERKIAISDGLTFGGATITDVDANQPYEEVLREVKRAVEPHLSEIGK